MLNKQQLKQAEETYLKAKYYYYVVGEPIMLDSTFDKLEEELKNNNSKVVELVDFPTIKEIEELGLDSANVVHFTKKDDVKYKHLTPYLSLEKIQINDEENIPYSTINNFLTRLNNIDKYECTLKYDGNGIECIYNNGELVKGLTRGDKVEGLDKTDKLKHIVPNKISFTKKCQVRGELVIDKEVWNTKYNRPKPGKISNPRNYISGVLNSEDYSIIELKDMTFVAYDFQYFENDEVNYIDNTMSFLNSIGFNINYNPIVINIKSIADFESMYYEMKRQREISRYLIDGIVIKFPENYRKILGFTNHHPKSQISVKFPASIVETTIIDIIYTLGKNKELTPVAILSPIELMGSIVRRASFSI